MTAATTGAAETASDQPTISEDWVAWRARVDETLRHVATKEDLAHLKVWMLLTSLTTSVTAGGLIVAALRLWPPP